jgi:hypothetical protein
VSILLMTCEFRYESSRYALRSEMYRTQKCKGGVYPSGEVFEPLFEVSKNFVVCDSFSVVRSPSVDNECVIGNALCMIAVMYSVLNGDEGASVVCNASCALQLLMSADAIWCCVTSKHGSPQIVDLAARLVSRPDASSTESSSHQCRTVWKHSDGCCVTSEHGTPQIDIW